VATVTNIQDSPKLRRRRLVYARAADQVLAIIRISGQSFTEIADYLRDLDGKAPSDDDAVSLGRLMQGRQ
jgi:hypothetical protein